VGNVGGIVGLNFAALAVAGREKRVLGFEKNVGRRKVNVVYGESRGEVSKTNYNLEGILKKERLYECRRGV
jgi:hypothetical protein